MKVALSIYKNQSDLFGVMASTICLVHCIATPFLFIAQSCSTTCCETSPGWWQWIDYLFLVISFVAIYQSSKTTSKVWIRKALWISWIVLAFVILNEKLVLIPLAEFAIYIPAIALIILHLYNHKYCKCHKNKKHNF